MRMWMVNPATMCRAHLLGEHRELHALCGMIRKGISLQGYIDKDLIEPQHIVARHEQLVREMERRGYNHQSPIDAPYSELTHDIDRAASARELFRRCSACRELAGAWYYALMWN